jgi:hypothetical protein
VERVAYQFEVERQLESKKIEVLQFPKSKGIEIELPLESIELSQELKGMDLD